MGLRGIFRYLLQETERKTGKPIHHLDGEEVSSPAAGSLPWRPYPAP